MKDPADTYTKDIFDAADAVFPPLTDPVKVAYVLLNGSVYTPSESDGSWYSGTTYEIRSRLINEKFVYDELSDTDKKD
jgi:hypothetical protein